MGAFPTFQRLVEDSLAFDLCVWKYQRVLRIDFEGCPGIFLGSFQDRLWWCMFDLSLHGIQDFWILDLGFWILDSGFFRAVSRTGSNPLTCFQDCQGFFGAVDAAWLFFQRCGILPKCLPMGYNITLNGRRLWDTIET